MSRIISADPVQLHLVLSEPGGLLSKNHPVHIFNDLVETEINVEQFIHGNSKPGAHGRPRYCPVMLLKVVLYGRMEGLNSNRDLAKACLERVDFRVLTGGLVPSFNTFRKFRADHTENLSNLFTSSVSIATEDGLVDMQEVAFDGTKILANASKHRAMSYGRMCEKVQALHQEMEALKKSRLDAQGRQQEEIEHELNLRRDRMAKLQEEKFALEDEHLEQHGELPGDKAQRNFTDSESRIMKKGSSFEQCYNAQAAVDRGDQIILAAYVTQACNDKQQLEPLVKCLQETVGMLPAVGLADAGYFSEAAVDTLKQKFKDTEWLVSPGRLSHRDYQSSAPKGRIPRDISTADRMRRKLSTKAGKASYARRKTIVEPAFGQIKEANLEFRRFSFRGLANVQNEWLFVCAAHNILKVIRHRLNQQKIQSVKQGKLAA